jgi:hypothetical protein
MKRLTKATDLDRLLKSAVGVDDESPEMPFGLETRVLALTRSGNGNGNGGIASLVQRVALAATCLIVISAFAIYRQMAASEESYGGLPTEYAMIDTAIQNAISR